MPVESMELKAGIPVRNKKQQQAYDSRKRYHAKNPWAQHLFSARARCRNVNNKNYYLYGGKGILCFLSLFEIRELWLRDKGHKLKRPSLDRKDSHKDYTYSNCRFIEYTQNAMEGAKRAAITCAKPVDQYTLENKYVKSFKSIGDAAKATGNYEHKYTIASCCRKSIYKSGRRLTAFGFIWRFKND